MRVRSVVAGANFGEIAVVRDPFPEVISGALVSALFPVSGRHLQMLRFP